MSLYIVTGKQVKVFVHFLLIQVSRCDYDGNNYEVVHSGVVGHVTDIHVDPYNG